VAQTNLVPEIRRILDETGLDPTRLNLEITESVVMENYTFTSAVLTQLQGLGVQIQVDDFGVGYSSLSYLSRFPLNALKIDRSFVSNMGQDNITSKIVQAIVMMTHGLGMKVIAEGVETKSQLDQLNALGCEFVQGYLIAKPQDSAASMKLLGKFYRMNGPNDV